MVNSKTFKISLIIFLSLFYVLLGVTSIGHIIKFWDISNNWVYPQILGVGNAIGILAAILLSFFPKEYGVMRTGYIIFALTAIVEIIGNIYYNYAVTNPNGAEFVLLMDFLKPLFNKYETSIDYVGTLRTYNAIFQGLWLPLTHIAVFNALARVIETYHLVVKKELVEVHDNEITIKSEIVEDSELNNTLDNNTQNDPHPDKDKDIEEEKNITINEEVTEDILPITDDVTLNDSDMVSNEDINAEVIEEMLDNPVTNVVVNDGEVISVTINDERNDNTIVLDTEDEKKK